MRAPVESGQILAGKYRVERVLGEGGMGVVVAAMHVDLREPRALKFLLPEALADAAAVERFLREGRAASRLKGAHVARVFDVGRLDDGAPYLVMEYLDGADLLRVLKKDGPLPIADVALYLLQTCEALAEAHARGIIHRDLKPSNLFLASDPDGGSSVKVLDFGISKLTGDATLTQSQTVLGSPYYMPPEQLRSSRDVDARADIWSLGVIGYQLLSGRLPFQGRNLTEIITAVITTSPTALSCEPEGVPGVPPALEAALLRCLEKDPDQRPASVAELGALLVPFASPEGAQHLATIERYLAGRGGAARMSIPEAAPPSQPVTGSSAWGATSGGQARASFPIVAGVIGGMAAAVVGMLAFSYAASSKPALRTDPSPAPAAASASTAIPVAAPLLPSSVPASTAPVAIEPVVSASAAAPSSPPPPSPAHARGRPQDPRVFGDRK